MTGQQAESVRSAEIIASLCLATDLAMGFPFEHGFHATLMAMELARCLDVDVETTRQVYYACLLDYSGCTTDVDKALDIFAGDLTEHFVPVLWGSPREQIKGLLAAMPPPDMAGFGRALEIAKRAPKAIKERKPHQRALCEVAEMLARRLGLPSEIHGLFYYLGDRWDGKGGLKRARGSSFPLALRISLLARDAAYQRLIGGEMHSIEVIGGRSGGAFDPEVVAVFLGESERIFAAADAGDSAWEQTLAVEPRPQLMLEDQAIDDALAAIGDFADLISPSLSGHSKGVAILASRAARRGGFSEADTTLIRRAAWVHDVGRVAIDPRVWEKPTELTPDEVEQVRLHPYHTERILIRSPFLGSLAAVASSHHEHLDGSGYHRGSGASTLSRAARLIAVADAYHAMTEPRPHRHPLSPETASGLLDDQVREGRYDPTMVSAVLEAAGQKAAQPSRPAGLTERETEVLGLLARGLQTKQIATSLGISPKTADTHIQHAYRKIEVSTRAAATLFAMEHGMVPSGVFPIPN
ncbi:MAG: HD domain-containing phosphohydrolase [Acidimicrobiia bacterium]